MAKKKTGVNIQVMMEMLIEQFGGMVMTLRNLMRKKQHNYAKILTNNK